MLVTRHRDQNQFSRYFYPWNVVGWIRLAEEDEQEESRELRAPPQAACYPANLIEGSFCELRLD